MCWRAPRPQFLMGATHPKGGTRPTPIRSEALRPLLRSTSPTFLRRDPWIGRRRGRGQRTADAGDLLRADLGPEIGPPAITLRRRLAARRGITVPGTLLRCCGDDNSGITCPAPFSAGSSGEPVQWDAQRKVHGCYRSHLCTAIGWVARLGSGEFPSRNGASWQSRRQIAEFRWKLAMARWSTRPKWSLTRSRR